MARTDRRRCLQSVIHLVQAFQILAGQEYIQVASVRSSSRRIRRFLDGVSQRCRMPWINTDVYDSSDQLCSLLFTLSNLCFVGCAYSKGFDERWGQCVGGHAWGVPFALTALPLLVRLIQSIRRWVDSKLITHLINVSLRILSPVPPLTYSTRVCRAQSMAWV